MKRILIGAIVTLIFGSSLMAAADDSGKNTIFTKLRDDLQTAVKNGHLSDAQKSALQAAGATLRQAAQAKKSGETVDQDAVKKAFADIKTIAESGAFEAPDASAVKDDLNAIQKAQSGQKKKDRKGLLRHILTSQAAQRL